MCSESRCEWNQCYGCVCRAPTNFFVARKRFERSLAGQLPGPSHRVKNATSPKHALNVYERTWRVEAADRLFLSFARNAALIAQPLTTIGTGFPALHCLPARLRKMIKNFLCAYNPNCSVVCYPA